MAEREKYYIALDGQTFEVSRELYEAYYKGHRSQSFPAGKILMNDSWRRKSSLRKKRRI